MQTIQKIIRRTTRVELNGRELAILEAALFDGMVRLLTDSKQFDPVMEEDDAYAMDARAEADTIRGIQRKLDFAQKMLKAEQ